MELSGTSFSAPMVSGVAALILGKHPGVHADQVKGASDGRHEADAAGSRPFRGCRRGQRRPLARDAATRRIANKALNAFVVSDSGRRRQGLRRGQLGGKAKNDASWAEASWADASWADASWSAASWADASWSDVSFASASWADTATAAASWADLSLASASWADNAGNEAAAPDAGAIDPAELAAILAGTLDP